MVAIGPPPLESFALLGPPTSKGSLLIWFIEKLVEKLPIWGQIWNAIDFNYQMSNPPSVVSYNNLIWYFHPGTSGPDVPIAYETYDGTAWSSQQGCPATDTCAGPGAAVFDGKIWVFYQSEAVGKGQLWGITYNGSSWSVGNPVFDTTVMSNCPSATAFNGEIYVFFQGPGLNGQLCYTHYNGSASSYFSTPAQVANVTMSASPSAITFTAPGGQPQLYVFHQGGGNNGQLWYNVLNTDGSWVGDRQIGGVTMQDAPVAAVYQNMIFVLYNGGSERLYYICSSDGNTWTTPVRVAQIASPCGPSVIAYNDALLYMLQSGNLLWYTPTAPGSSTSVMSPTPQQITASTAPTSLIYNDVVYCFTNSNGAVNFNTFSTSGWAIGGTAPGTMSGSPGPVVFNGQLYIFYQRSDDSGALCYTCSPDGNPYNFSAETTVANVGMTATPSPVVYEGTLYVFHQGYSDAAQIWYCTMSSSGQWSGDHQIPGSAIPNMEGGSGGMGNSPSAIVYNGTLFVFYTGAPGGVNTLCYTSFQNGGWTAQQSVPAAASLNVATPFCLLPYDDGSGLQLYCYYRNYNNNGIYYVATADPSNASSWSAPAEVGAVIPPGQTPQGAGADIANWAVTAIGFVASPD